MPATQVPQKKSPAPYVSQDRYGHGRGSSAAGCNISYQLGRCLLEITLHTTSIFESDPQPPIMASSLSAPASTPTTTNESSNEKGMYYLRFDIAD